jgi:hypothetical protein
MWKVTHWKSVNTTAFIVTDPAASEAGLARVIEKG